MLSGNPEALAAGILVFVLAGWVAVGSRFLSRIADANLLIKMAGLALIVPGLLMVGAALSIAAIGVVAVLIAVLVAGQN